MLICCISNMLLNFSNFNIIIHANLAICQPNKTEICINWKIFILSNHTTSDKLKLQWNFYKINDKSQQILTWSLKPREILRAKDLLRLLCTKTSFQIIEFSLKSRKVACGYSSQCTVYFLCTDMESYNIILSSLWRTHVYWC